ncbi:MAG: DUF2520 domain-containing protein [Gammaproteobacteria bacterium]
MRQVPYYLIIGNGRVAHHFQHYFSLLPLPFTTWHRQESLEDLAERIKSASHILLLIRDDAIENFIRLYLQNLSIVHFSGSLVTPLAYGAHPLMTFNNRLYTLEHYQSIPFVLDHNAPAFENILPGLPNQHVRLDTALKAKYHALCVLSGNFSCLLWQKLFSSLEKEFKFPASIAHTFIQQQTQNLVDNYQTALTGPLPRNDLLTLEKNLLALNGDPFQQIYQAFITCYPQRAL